MTETIESSFIVRLVGCVLQQGVQLKSKDQNSINFLPSEKGQSLAYQ